MAKKETIGQTFGRKLREFREAKGLNKYKLSKETGINAGYLGELEAGEKVPGWEKVCKLADTLGVSVADFR
jgi:transcriptional regulator with XRE-family HTH domain